MKRGERHIPTQVVGDRPRRAGADPHQLIGASIDGRYRILRGIAGGSMGHVYEAIQEPFERRVALKVLSSRGDERFEKRFRREASTAAQLAHPNIVTIYDYGETPDGQVYMVMEYLDGRPLARALDEDGVFSLQRALGVSIQIARALRKAHDRGVIHRDLKPSNIMLLPSEDELDFVKVLDFGLVKLFEAAGELRERAPSVYGERLTTVGAMLGTPGYMSPEQAMGESIDARTDVYACGVILYELLTGKLPFEAETLPELLSQQVMRPVSSIAAAAPEGADLPDELETLVASCLHRDREARPASADELLARLKGIWRFETDESYGTEVSMASPLAGARVLPPAGEPSEVRERASGARSESALADGARRLRRARLLALTAALACLLALAAAYVFLEQRASAPPRGAEPTASEEAFVAPPQIAAPPQRAAPPLEEAPLPEGDPPEPRGDYKSNPY